MFLAESIPLDVGPHTCPCPCRKHLLPTLLHLPPLPRFHVCAHSSWSFPFLCLFTRMPPFPQAPAPGSPRRAAGAAAVARAAIAAAKAAAAGVQAATVVANIYNVESQRAQSEDGVLVPPELPPPLPQATPPPTHTHTLLTHMLPLIFFALCISLSHNSCQPPSVDVPPAIARGRKRKVQVSIVFSIMINVAFGIIFFFQAPEKDLEVPVPEPIRTRSRTTSTLRSGKF